MPKTHSINIRVSRQQKEVIENNAKANGYKNVSDYIRTRGLCFHPYEEKINDIHKKLNLERIPRKNLGEIDKNLFEYI